MSRKNRKVKLSAEERERQRVRGIEALLQTHIFGYRDVLSPSGHRTRRFEDSGWNSWRKNARFGDPVFVTGIGEVRVVESAYSPADGCFLVFEISAKDGEVEYFRKNGHYDSFGGSEWDSGGPYLEIFSFEKLEVLPTTTITSYEKCSGTTNDRTEMTKSAREVEDLLENAFDPETEDTGWGGWVEFGWSGTKVRHVPELGDVKIVEDFGGEGQGDTRYLVFQVTDEEGEVRLFQKDGYYSSYNGSDWDGDFYEVVETKEIVTVYKQKR
jgi:hypothetical protein